MELNPARQLRLPQTRGEPFQALPAMGGINGDVVNEESFFVNIEDEYPHDDASVAFGDGYLLVSDELCVIVGHRARQYPDTLDVVAVGGLNKCGHFRGIWFLCGSQRI